MHALRRATVFAVIGLCVFVLMLNASARQLERDSSGSVFQESSSQQPPKAEDSKAQQPNAAPAPARPALPEPKNLQLLKDMPMPQVIQQMRAISAALGVECSYCHVNPFPQDTPRKNTARLMLRDYVMGMKHKDGSALSCNDCHMGQANFLRTRPFENAVNKAMPDRQLKAAIPDDKIMEAMDSFSKALGVKCEYCHTSDPEEETPRKQIARFMFTQFTQGLVKSDGTAVACMDCHQGHARPLTVLPFPRRQRSDAAAPNPQEAKKPSA